MELPKRVIDFTNYTGLRLITEKAVEPENLYRKKYHSPSSGMTWSGHKIEFVTSADKLKKLIPNGSTVLQANHFPSKPVDSMSFSDPKIKGAVVYTIKSDNKGNDILIFMKKERVIKPSIGNTEVQLALKPLGIERMGQKQVSGKLAGEVTQFLSGASTVMIDHPGAKSGKVSCFVFTSAATLSSTIIKNMDNIPLLNDNPSLKKTLIRFVQGGCEHMVWPKDNTISEAEKNWAAKRFSELAIGVKFLKGTMTIAPFNTLTGAKEVAYPNDPQFGTIDLFVNRVAISAKAGSGAKANLGKILLTILDADPSSDLGKIAASSPTMKKIKEVYSTGGINTQRQVVWRYAFYKDTPITTDPKLCDEVWETVHKKPEKEWPKKVKDFVSKVRATFIKNRNTAQWDGPTPKEVELFAKSMSKIAARLLAHDLNHDVNAKNAIVFVLTKILGVTQVNLKDSEFKSGGSVSFSSKVASGSLRIFTPKSPVGDMTQNEGWIQCEIR